MKVQTKITLLLATVVAVFLAGLGFLRSYEKLKFHRIAEERFTERNQSFDKFLESYGLPLKTLAEDSTCLDRLVQAIAGEDRSWLTQYFSDATLASFRANAVWVFRPDGSLLYQNDNLHADPPPDLGLSPDIFATLFASAPLRHFFIKVPLGYMEIWAGTVHPSQDFRRQSPAYGYLFTGRLWSKRGTGDAKSDSVIGEMSLFTNNEIRLVPADAQIAEGGRDGDNGLAVFSRPLPGWNGAPLARLLISSDSPVIRELNRSSQRLLVALILFALLLLLFLTVSLQRWVRRPLQRIMDSLEHHDPRPLSGWQEDSSEFGALARTVRNFFEQRRNLFQEMSERRATEEALRKSEEELRHAQKLEAVGRLAGGVAHDFNNLLTAILGYAELLDGRAKDPASVRQSAQLIRKAGEQAAALTRQLLAFSRKQLLQPKVIDLNQLVVEMERLLRRVIGERFELVTRPEAKAGRVRADPNQLEQVIMNLGVNARDAMPEGGQLLIRTSNQTLTGAEARRISPSLGGGEYVLLIVTDSGEGMDNETRSHIFEPFFTTKGPGKGTGLGLATVYGIVSQSGGGIVVESAPGAGSSFTIYLPQEEAPIDPVRPLPGPVEPSREAETVLVVEDEEIVRQLVCDVLENQGYRVLCAANGHEALQIAGEFEGRIHLLVTDVIMPHLNGHELAARLSAQRPGTRVLYVSGYSDSDIGLLGVLSEGADLLEKPFTPQALAQKIQEILRRPTPDRAGATVVSSTRE